MQALELVRPALGELQPRTGYEFRYHARNQHFTRPGLSHHAGGDVDRDATDIAVAQLDLARVKPCSQWQA
jgi:hypothetical protein